MANTEPGPGPDQGARTNRLSDRMRRSLHDMALHSPLLRWRGGIEPGDRLLLVPQTLRTLDPSFLTELESGCLGLAGSVANYGGGSPFAITAPNTAWADDLHGFGWIHHLRAAETDDARQIAEDWVTDWMTRYKRPIGQSWEPETTARRLISLLSGAGFVLKGADAKFHDAYVASANTHLRYLAKSYATAPDGMRRLLILTAIMYGSLCIADQDRMLEDFLPAFGDELKRQILPDGSAVSRETTSIVEIVLDLLPLNRCFTSRDKDVPVALAAALQRAILFVAHMRLGDGMLARFNGVSGTWPDRVAAILAYRDIQNPPIEEARHSGYARMKRGNSIVLMDVGVPPRYEASILAHAGCLSFEMSSGTAPLFVNCGAPGPADLDWRPLGRGTAAHSTLVLNETSSSVLVRNPEDEKRLGGIPIEGPERVERVIEEKSDGAMTVSAWHDGYVSRFGIQHERILRMDLQGTLVEGTDKLSGGGKMFAGRGQQVQPFAIRFHLHPRARVRRPNDTGAIHIRLANGETWEFSADGSNVNLEESVFLAELSGPLQTVQIVLRGRVADRTEMHWRLRKLSDEQRAEDEGSDAGADGNQADDDQRDTDAPDGDNAA